MNRKFFEHYIYTQPATTEQKYIFLVDNEDIAMNIVATGYLAVALVTDSSALDK